jgi:hypothetical protein
MKSHNSDDDILREYQLQLIILIVLGSLDYKEEEEETCLPDTNIFNKVLRLTNEQYQGIRGKYRMSIYIWK